MQELSDHVAGVDLPDSELTQAAWSLLWAFAAGRLMNHSMRTFLWASHLGGGVSHNNESPLIAFLLHDNGVDAFDPHRLPSEQASAHLAEVFLAGPDGLQLGGATVMAAIRSHLEDDAPDSAEAELIRIRVGVDVSGRRFGDVEQGLAAAVLARSPRLGFKHLLHPTNGGAGGPRARFRGRPPYDPRTGRPNY